jgi:hypothetical protein
MHIDDCRNEIKIQIVRLQICQTFYYIKFGLSVSAKILRIAIILSELKLLLGMGEQCRYCWENNLFNDCQIHDTVWKCLLFGSLVLAAK